MSNLKKAFFLFIGAIFAIPLIANTYTNTQRYFKVKNDINLKKEKLSGLTLQNQELTDDIISFNDNDKEALVRDKLSMTKEGETIIILPDELLDGEKDNIKNQKQENKTNWQKWRDLFL